MGVILLPKFRQSRSTTYFGIKNEDSEVFWGVLSWCETLLFSSDNRTIYLNDKWVTAQNGNYLFIY